MGRNDHHIFNYGLQGNKSPVLEQKNIYKISLENKKFKIMLDLREMKKL